jgi:hypothetical protein
MKNYFFFRYVIFLILIGIAVVASISAQNKYALVIGNANYQRIDKLNNTINDAQDIGTALRGLGYNVDIKTDLRHLDMVDAMDAFITRLGSSRNSEGFFWYAGHAVQIREENYLLPVDVSIETESRVRAQSYSLNNLLEALEGVRNKANVVVLDSCRDNPLPTNSRGSGTRGLSVVRQVPDLFIMFSTAPGEKADDGVGKRNSPFAEAFLKYIRSTEPLQITAAHIFNETLSLTGGRQRPYHSGSIISDAYYSLNPSATPFVTPVPAQPTPAPVVTPPQTFETNNIKNSSVYLNVNGDLNNRVRDAFAKVLSAEGLRTQGSNSPYTLDININMNETTYPNNNNIFYQYTVSANLIERNTDSVLLPFNFSGREGHTTHETAKTRVFIAIERTIADRYHAAFKEYLAASR